MFQSSIGSDFAITAPVQLYTRYNHCAFVPYLDHVSVWLEERVKTSFVRVGADVVNEKHVGNGIALVDCN